MPQDSRQVSIAALTGPDGRADRSRVCALVHRIAGVSEPDLLSREQVQKVYDELERLIEHRNNNALEVRAA